MEAGAKGKVIVFDIPDDRWDAERMVPQRGLLIDALYGLAYPLRGRHLDAAMAEAVRERVAQFCLEQADRGKPYNLNFFNSQTTDAFYCSQLAYQAYLQNEIDLNTGLGIPNLPGTKSIIFPQEIWSGCVHERPAD